MLSILVMNLNLSTSSSDLTLSQITKQHVQTVTDMLTYDIPKIGFAQDGKVDTYNNPGTGNPYLLIKEADSSKIVFHSDIDNDGDIDEIRWELTADPVANTNNPNDFVLVRSMNGVDTEIRSGVTKFTINYYDEYGEKKAAKMATPVSAANLDDIVQIDIELVIESREKIRYSVGSDGRYVKSAWEKRYTPRNLQ